MVFNVPVLFVINRPGCLSLLGCFTSLKFMSKGEAYLSGPFQALHSTEKLLTIPPNIKLKFTRDKNSSLFVQGISKKSFIALTPGLRIFQPFGAGDRHPETGINGTVHFKKCKQLFGYQHLLLLRDIWWSNF